VVSRIDFLPRDIQNVVVQTLVARDQKLALLGTAAGGSGAIDIIARVNGQPIGFGNLMSVYKSSPPGHSTLLVLSATGGDVAPNVAAEHDLQFAVGRTAIAPLQSNGESTQTDQGREQSRPCLRHRHSLS
jgi:hypothetical protein